MYNVDTATLYQSNADFWTASRRRHFETFCRHATETGELDQAQLEAFMQSVAGGRKCPPRRLEIQIRKLLTETNKLGLTDASLPAISIPFVRPSHLPGKAGEFGQLPAIDDLQRYIWETWFETPRTTDDLMLAVAVTLALDAGYGKPVIVWLLQQLLWSDLREDGTVIVPFDRILSSRGATKLGLPETTRLLLYVLHARARPPENSFVVCPELSTDHGRREGIRKRLKRAYEKLATDFTKSTGKTAPELDLLLRVGRLIPILDGGLEPFFVAVTGDRHLPTAQKGGVPLMFAGQQRALRFAALQIDRKTLVAIPRETESTRADDDWCAKARNQIAIFLKDLRPLAPSEGKTKGKLNGARKTAEVHALIDQRLVEADRLSGNTTSALHLALRFIHSRFRPSAAHKNPTLRTVETYLSRVFTAHLLHSPDAIDLTLWDPEEIEIEIQSWLEAVEHEPNTLKNLGITCKRVFQFAEQNGFCPGIDIAFVLESGPGGTARAAIVDLFEFDRFLRALLPAGPLDWSDDRARDAALIALACILGFYGGTRASEVTALTLDNVIIGDGDCWIQILGGKTPAARRGIPLHLLAPGWVCQWVETVVAHRRAEFPDNALLANIPLFGPRGCRDRYTRRALIEPAIACLKQAFGRDVVFHSLRHAFASWLVVRWYALRYPDVVTPLTSRTHEVFLADGRARLAELFTLLRDTELDPTCPSDLVIISKTLGHLGQRTLFRCYVQTFGLLHRHALDRLDRCYHTQRRLSGEVMSALVPKMASDHSQAKVTDKTVRGMMTYLKEARGWTH